MHDAHFMNSGMDDQMLLMVLSVWRVLLMSWSTCLIHGWFCVWLDGGLCGRRFDVSVNDLILISEMLTVWMMWCWSGC